MRWLAALLAGAVTLAGACSGDSYDGAGGDGDRARPAVTAAPSPPPASPPSTTTPTGPSPSTGCADPTPATPGTTDRTLRSGGEARRYQVVLPTAYDGREPLPVVLALHALTVPYGISPSIYGLTDDPDRRYVIVAPSGLLDRGTPYWLAVPSEENHDLAFLDDLLDRIGRDLCVDEARVFSTGMSNGGQMSALVACRLPDRITAVAPVAGVEFDDAGCTGDPVPVMAFHGDADPVVTYGGGGLNATTIANQQFWHGEVPDGLPVHGGVDEAMASWADHNGCGSGPTEERVAPDVVRRTWAGCAAPVVLYVAEGHGHTWPGRPVAAAGDRFGTTTTSIDATALITEFFLG